MTPILQKKKIRERDWIEKYVSTSIYRQTASKNVKVSGILKFWHLEKLSETFLAKLIPILHPYCQSFQVTRFY